jgi:hypothetical protein
MVKKFDYDDINLIPRYSVVDSRSECDTSVQLGKFSFKNPVIPANMESVIDEKLAMQLAKAGYFYILHRFNIDSKSFIKNMKKEGLITSISIGVNEDSYSLLKELILEDLLPDYITIDIAHGHCKKMKKILKFIKDNEIKSFIIAGNVASVEATVDLDNWGADAIKCGIGTGSACFLDGVLIKTNKGYKKIEDISIGDKVLTHKNRYKTVINTISFNTSKNLININGNICTEDHKFLIVNKSDINDINDNNYMEFAYWMEAKNIIEDIHMLLCIT